MGQKRTDVHTEHCCILHGCKYGKENCSVTRGVLPQSYQCESCELDGIKGIPTKDWPQPTDKTIKVMKVGDCYVKTGYSEYGNMTFAKTKNPLCATNLNEPHNISFPEILYVYGEYTLEEYNITIRRIK